MVDVNGTAGTNPRNVRVSANHDNWDERNSAVFIEVRNVEDIWLSKWAVVSVENAEKLRDELTRVIDEFNANKPKPPTTAEILAPLGVGAVMRCSGEQSKWVKLGENAWNWQCGVKFGNVPDEFFNWTTVEILSEGVK